METPDEWCALSRTAAVERDALAVPAAGTVLALAPTGFVSRIGNRSVLVVAGTEVAAEFAFIYDARIIAAVATADYLFTCDITGSVVCSGLDTAFPPIATDAADDALQPVAPDTFAVTIIPHPTKPVAVFVTEQQALWLDFAAGTAAPLSLPHGSVSVFDAGGQLLVFDAVAGTRATAVGGKFSCSTAPMPAAIVFTVPPDVGAWKLAYLFGLHVAIIAERAVLFYDLVYMHLISIIYIKDPSDITATSKGLVVATMLGDLVSVYVDQETSTLVTIPAVFLHPCTNYTANSVIRGVGDDILVFAFNTRRVYRVSAAAADDDFVVV